MSKTKILNLKNLCDRVGEKTRVNIVTLLKEDKYITNQKLANVLGLSAKGIEWQMKKLKESGVIQRVGGAKGGYWEVVDV